MNRGEGSADKITYLFRIPCIFNVVCSPCSVHACWSRQHGALNKGQQKGHPPDYSLLPERRRKPRAPYPPLSRCKILGIPDSCKFLPGAAKLLGLPWSMGVKCWPPSLHQPGAGCCCLPFSPFQKLLKEIPGGRWEDGTSTRASVQAAGANKRGFSQTNGASAGLVSRDF